MGGVPQTPDPGRCPADNPAAGCGQRTPPEAHEAGFLREARGSHCQRAAEAEFELKAPEGKDSAASTHSYHLGTM